MGCAPRGLFPLRPETRKCRAGVGENVPQGHPRLGMIHRVLRTVMKAGLPPPNLHWVLLELSFHLDSSLCPPAQDSPSCYREEAPGGPRQGPAVLSHRQCAPGLTTPAYGRAQGSHSHPGLCSWTVHTPKGRQRAVTPYPHLLGSVTCFLGPNSWWQAFAVCLWQTMPQCTAERLSFCTPLLRLCPLLGPRTNRWVSGQGPSGLHGQPRLDTWLPLGSPPL